MTKSKLLTFSAAIVLILCLSASLFAVFGVAVTPVANAIVSASGVTTSSGGSAITDSNGNYQINSYLATDSFTMTASASGFIDTTVSNVAVTAGSTTSGVNIVMPVSGGISGRVTDAVSSAPLSAFVSAANTTGTGPGFFALTDANGNYQISTDLATGNYNVSVTFQSGYLDQTLTNVAVTQGAITPNTNFAMTRSGVITGTVTDSVSNAPQSGDSISVTNAVSGAYITGAVTNSSGGYVLNTNLRTGTYNVSVSFPTGHLPKTVGPIAVTTGAQTVQNIAINPSGTISGKITSGGQGLAGASVTAYSSDFVYFGSAQTDSNGNYQINTDLGSGTYTVAASYQGALNQASGVVVVAGQTTPNINIALTVTPTGSISGKVTSTQGGAGLSGVTVSAVGTGFNSGSNTTDSSGNYIISGLPADAYNVTSTLIGFTSASRSPVTVTVNVVTAGVNFQLTPLPSGIITGQVTTQGTPLPTPTPVPTASPTPSPSPSPSPTPTTAPTPTPTPTVAPTVAPTIAPTTAPTIKPAASPTSTPKPTTTSTPKPTPTPTIPEFPMWTIPVSMIGIPTLAAVVMRRKREKTKT